MTDQVIHSIIFGFGYKMRSGKDTAADWIKLNRNKSSLVFNGYTIKRYGFADELKREVTQCALKSGGMMSLFSDGLREEGCGFLQTNGNVLALPEWVQPDPDPDMTDPLLPLGKHRLFLQWYGGEYRRGADPLYWVNIISKLIATDKPEIALISDLRYFNEFLFCQKYGECVRIDRPDAPVSTAAAGVCAHASETELDKLSDEAWDDIVVNNSTLAEFRERVLFSFDMLMTTHPLARPASGN